MAEYTHGPATSVTIPQEKTQRADHQTDDIHAHMSSYAVCLGTSEMFSECLMVPNTLFSVPGASCFKALG